MGTSDDVDIKKDTSSSSCVGLTPNALSEVRISPEEKGSKTGASTRSTFIPNINIHTTEDIPHWYVLRCAYGQERKAYQYIIEHKGVAYYPTIKEIREVNGKRKCVEVSRLPNIFFAYGLEEAIKGFVYDNVNLPFLRFYYEHFHVGSKIEKRPLIVPDNQIEGLKLICESEADDIIIEFKEIPKFKTGQLVRVTQGNFKGVVGHVARYQGQQRVAIIIDGILTVVTAYIPKAFIEII